MTIDGMIRKRKEKKKVNMLKPAKLSGYILFTETTKKLISLKRKGDRKPNTPTSKNNQT